MDEIEPTMEDLDRAHRALAHYGRSGIVEAAFVLGVIGATLEVPGDPTARIREARSYLSAYRTRHGIMLPER